MAEYIEREATLKEAESRIMWGASASAVYESIEDAPAAYVAPVRHGRWENYDGQGYLVCSECRDVYIDKDWLKDGKWNYCPNCGARMDGDKNA